MRLLLGSILHESNTFSGIKTSLASFRKVQLLIGKPLIDHHANKRTEIGGMLAVLRDQEVEIVPTISATALPSGRITSRAFNAFRHILLSSLEGTEVNGVLLALHGAMLSEGIDDCEGHLLEEIHGLIGEHAYIGATLDMHANVSDRMVKYADFLIGYRTHPHIDQWDVGRSAADTILSLIREQIRPTMVMQKLPMIIPAETRPEPRAQLFKQMEMLDNTTEVISSSFFLGYPWADVSAIGPSVVVVTRNNLELARTEANNLARLFWRLRKDFALNVVSIDSAIDDALRLDGGPIVFCDMGDSLFAGAAGDVTTILAALIKRKVENTVIAAIVDPHAVHKAITIGEGRKATLEIGGRLDRLNSRPLKVTGTIARISTSQLVKDPTLEGYESNQGHLVIFRTDGIEIVLAERRGKVYPPTFLYNLGIEPEKKKIIVIKDGIGPVVTYKSLARKVIFVNSPGWSCQDFGSLNYGHIPRPIFPLDVASM